MTDLWKLRIKERFLKAVRTYEEEAVVQREMAERLVERLKGLGLTEFDSVFEIGAGTGLLTRLLTREVSFSLYIACDLVKECGRFFKETPVKFVAGDGEEAGWLKRRFDLVTSNAVFQWFKDIGRAAKRLKSLLKHGGILAFTTFGPLTMKELRRSEVPPAIIPKEDLLRLFSEEGFELLWWESWERSLEFRDRRELLRHIRNTGALGGLKASDTLSFYEGPSQNGTLVLTYEPVLTVWRRP